MANFPAYLKCTFINVPKKRVNHPRHSKIISVTKSKYPGASLWNESILIKRRYEVSSTGEMDGNRRPLKLAGLFQYLALLTTNAFVK